MGCLYYGTINIESPACWKVNFLQEMIWSHFQPNLVLQHVNNSASSCSVLAAVISVARPSFHVYTNSQTHTRTESGLSCYGFQGYGNLGLFGLECRDSLALSDRYAGVIVVALNFLQGPSYLSYCRDCVLVCAKVFAQGLWLPAVKPNQRPLSVMIIVLFVYFKKSSRFSSYCLHIHNNVFLIFKYIHKSLLLTA